MTYKDYLNIAINQSAIDLSCEPEHLLNGKETVVISKASSKASAFLDLPLPLSILSFGSGIVASCCEELRDIAQDYISTRSWYECFSHSGLICLEQKLRPLGYCVKYEAVRFLPDSDSIPELSCKYEIRRLEQKDFADLYREEWSNALCEKRKNLDIIGFGAYDSGKLAALAGCSADCENMYQIGIDVLPEYRRNGIASCLTSRLAKAVIDVGKVPFYSAVWSNLPSVRNAVRCGFKPAWVAIDCKRTAKTLNETEV